MQNLVFLSYVFQKLLKKNLQGGRLDPLDTGRVKRSLHICVSTSVSIRTNFKSDLISFHVHITPLSCQVIEVWCETSTRRSCKSSSPLYEG